MARAAAGAREAVRSTLSNPVVWIWVGIWIATRALIVADVGFWNHVADLRLQDINDYDTWSQYITTNHALPDEETWQYPPGAAFLMLVPRLGPGTYAESFVGLMLIVDLIGLALLAQLGRRSGNYTGVWVWLLGIPLLGALPVLRFDLVPAVIGIAALVVIHRRPHWFGALAGFGASIKVWPIVLLFGEWDRRRLLRAAIAALAAVALVFLVSAIAFGDQSAFLDEQSGRGLQEEAIATAPWQLREIVTGEVPQRAVRYGAWEITTDTADAVAGLLKWLTLAALAGAAAWWLCRARAIRGGRTDLAHAAVSRDFVFTVVLLLVATSRVLSPQFMIWLLGLAAVVLTAGTTRLARPAWLVVGATILSTSAFGSAENTLIRNLALAAATVDASIAMILLVRRPAAQATASPTQTIRLPSSSR
jgi:glycosyl transferase family 87